MPTSFKRQLLNIRVGHEIIVIVNIYRRPSASKTVFIDELADLLTALCFQVKDHLLTVCDLNLPGQIRGELDDGFAELLDQLGLVQHVKDFDMANDRGNILDLVITRETSNLVTATSVVTNHQSQPRHL